MSLTIVVTSAPSPPVIKQLSISLRASCEGRWRNLSGRTVRLPFSVLGALFKSYWLVSSTLFMCINEASSDERILDIAAPLTIVPLGPVKPAWRDSFTVNR